MNYRHQFHAGNFADVMKHVLLVGLVRGLQRKAGGFVFLDTHAGRGIYELAQGGQGARLPRAPEHPGGIGRILGREGLPEPLAGYAVLVRGFNAVTQGIRFYPGSPRLVKLLARPQDRLVLCEQHAEEWGALRAHFQRERKVSVQAMDGYLALRAQLPPPERRGLVLIDPPFEEPGEVKRILDAMGEGLERFPGGTYAIWYPLTERVMVPELLRGLTKLKPPPTLVADLIVEPDAEKMSGCGLVVVNPPWQFDREIEPSLRVLADLLARAPGANASLRWLAPEKS
ncbi:MAG TPA: 23S rRNA (adenine(2030)-N(6))-methyltransferase RlmJ [Opitutaceae bacterium]|nr:23S rRNA (adenine(2030)-N(6))-methyltransferase RlmJ [Opitutaceae bacterium]